MTSANHIILEEQGLRDGLQTLPIIVPLDTKLRWVQKLANAGLKRMQIASFVNTKLIPQMADAEQLIKSLPDMPGVIISGLVLNIKGVERATAAGIKHFAISVSASDTHSKKNTNKSLSESKNELKEMLSIASKKGNTVRGGIQCAFGCRYEGKINEAVIYDLVKFYLDCGVQELALADSTGMANPLQIKSIMEEVFALCGKTPVALHLHNTENKGYANLCAAVEVGIRQFDTAFGGLGGCPFIKGATGNIATEDSVHMLHQMGYETGVDINKVSEVSKEMEQLLGEKLPGLMYKQSNLLVL